MPRDQYRNPLEAPVGRGRVAVNRVHSDLEAERWLFYYYEHEHALALDSYKHFRRPTKRHGWKVEESYERLASDRDRFNMASPPLPDDVKSDAWKEFAKTVRVGLWEEVVER